MKTNCLPFDCEACGHQWDEQVPLLMHVDLFILRIQIAGCPNCGTAEKLLINFYREQAAA